MPINYYWESEGFVMEASGIITAEEIFEADEAFLNFPKGVVPRYQLVDALNALEVRVSELEMVDISADDLAVSRKLPQLKVALIANEGPVMEKFIKYLKVSWAINTTWDIRIFNSLEAAWDWLKIKS